MARKSVLALPSRQKSFLDRSWAAVPVFQGRWHKEQVAEALVDCADLDLVLQYAWHLKDGYAVFQRYNAKTRYVRMHRLILGLGDSDKREPDHINRNRLDNRRSNLRIVTHKENTGNVSKQQNVTSSYRGVSWHQNAGKWRAAAWIDGKRIHLGYFVDEEDAGRVARQFRIANMKGAVD